MPDYEELYNTARQKYDQAVDELYRIRRDTAELQEKKKALTSQLSEKQSVLSEVQHKKELIHDALGKCRHIVDNEYPAMKRDVQTTAEEYKKIITSDLGVADLQEIYSSDLQSTLNDLNAITTDLECIFKNLASQENTAQSDVNNCSNELNNVIGRLNNVGSESYAQWKINLYYTEMQEYKNKWENGE